MEINNYHPSVELSSNPWNDTQTLYSRIGDKVFWDWWEYQSVDRATLIFKVITDYLRSLNRAGYTLVKIADLNKLHSLSEKAKKK